MKEHNINPKRKAKGFFVIIMVSLFIIFGCKNLTTQTTQCSRELSSQPSFHFNEISDYDSLQIQLNFDNKANSYVLTILGNKTYHYIRTSPKRGEIIGNFSDETLLYLLTEFKNNKFNYMKEEYWCSQATDLGYTKITLGFDNKQHL